MGKHSKAGRKEGRKENIPKLPSFLPNRGETKRKEKTVRSIELNINQRAIHA